MTIFLQEKELIVAGFPIVVDHQMGHIAVAHDGAISWDQLQAIKNAIWGADARAVEVYPRQGDLVNSGNFRHLWRLGEGDFCPDLLMHDASDTSHGDSLEQRHRAAWAEADEVFR
jgi:hypothetical protein